jgi:hypothetical protein
MTQVAHAGTEGLEVGELGRHYRSAASARQLRRASSRPTTCARFADRSLHVASLASVGRLEALS